MCSPRYGNSTSLLRGKVGLLEESHIYLQSSEIGSHKPSLAAVVKASDIPYDALKL